MKRNEFVQWIVDLKWSVPHSMLHLAYHFAYRSYAKANHEASPMKPGSMAKLTGAERAVASAFRSLQWSSNRMPSRLRHDHRAPFQAR